MPRVALNPPIIKAFGAERAVLAVIGYLRQIFDRVGEGPLLVQGYDVNDLPDASEWGSIDSDDPFSALIFIYNETGGPVWAGSDGTNWRRTTDRAIVS